MERVVCLHAKDRFDDGTDNNNNADRVNEVEDCPFVIVSTKLLVEIL